MQINKHKYCQTQNLLKPFKKYIRTWTRSKGEIRSRMNKWWIQFKCTSIPCEAPAGGQYDPDIDGTWFTNGTKEAFKSCKQHADHIADTLSRNNLYEGLALSLCSTNQLTILGKEIVG